MKWNNLIKDQFLDTGGHMWYYATFFRKGLKQIEIFVEIMNNETMERAKTVGVNIGNLTKEIIDEIDTPGFPAFIQGDYDEVKEFPSYEEALIFAKSYMEAN